MQNPVGPDTHIEDLIAQVALRNRGAYEQLYERSSSKLLGVCMRILRERSEAEDALQEAFVKVWHRASSFDANKARGMTWLSTIARNQAIDHLRARRTHQNIDEAEAPADENESGPEATVLAVDQHQKMKDCLDELEEKRREIVKNTYLGGWTYQQAADALEVPLNTVKTWIRRSLLALRECVSR